MFGRKKPEVLVVGAGPVGLFAALTLAHRGVRVRIVDKEWRPAAHSYALALHARSLELFDDLNLLAPVLKQAYRVRSVGLYDDQQRRAELRLSDLSEDFSFLAVMRQDLLEDTLETALNDLGVKVQWNHQVSQIRPHADEVEVTIDKLETESVGYAVAHTEWRVVRSKTLNGPFVIGADGHHSSVRRALRIDFPEVAPAQHFAVFEFKTDADLEHEMRMVLTDDTANVLWPLPDGYCRWSFQVSDYDASPYSRRKDRFEIQLGGGRYPMLSEDQLHAFLGDRAPWFTGSVEDLRWRLLVRFEHRLAEAFAQGRVGLVGDAGHMTGPVGIQSMNVGLREARDLARVVAGILHDTQPLDRLTDYHRQRTDEWRFLLGLDGGLQATETTEPWIAEQRKRLLPCLPTSGNDLSSLARQLGLDATPHAEAALS